MLVAFRIGKPVSTFPGNALTDEILRLRPPSRDHGDELSVSHRLAEDVALHQIAAQLHQCPGVLAGLDADSDGAAGKVVSNLNHALADICVAGVARAALHERRVDLDFREWQISEQGERGVAATKIIDR